MLFRTPLCDPCLTGWRRLPLAADCACAVGSPFAVRLGVLVGDFNAHLFVRALAAYLGLLPSQVAVTSVTTFGDPMLVGDEYLAGDQVNLTNLTNVTVFSDKTLVAFELLPLQPPWFYDWEVLNLTSVIVSSTLVYSDQVSPWPAVFGGVMVRRRVCTLIVSSSHARAMCSSFPVQRYPVRRQHSSTNRACHLGASFLASRLLTRCSTLMAGCAPACLLKQSAESRMLALCLVLPWAATPCAGHAPPAPSCAGSTSRHGSRAPAHTSLAVSPSASTCSKCAQLRLMALSTRLLRFTRGRSTLAPGLALWCVLRRL